MQKAFTLIELLVVVLIIGVLAAIALPQYQKAVLRAQFTEVELNLRALYDAQQRYYLANGNYATELSDLDIEISPGKDLGGMKFDRYSLSARKACVLYYERSYTTDSFCVYLNDESNCSNPVSKGTIGAESFSTTIRSTLGFATSGGCGIYPKL